MLTVVKNMLTAEGVVSGSARWLCVAFWVTLVGGCPGTPVGNGNDNVADNANSSNIGNDNESGVDNENDNGTGGTNQQIIVFADPDSEFMTSDVYDVDDQIVQFVELDEMTSRMVWTEDGTVFSDDWRIDGLILNSGFQIRFGTQNGERRVYFTEIDPPTICDIENIGGNVRISSTNVTVPQE